MNKFITDIFCYSVLTFHEVNGSRHVYGAGDDTTIKGWDLTTGNVVVTLAGHYSKITDIAFHHDNRHFVRYTSNLFNIAVRTN